MKISQTKPLFSQTKPLFSKPASWPHITVAIGLVVLTFYILARALNVLVNDSSVFPNERQNAILIAIIIVGIFFFGMGVIIEEWFFFRQVRSKILHSLVVSILVGVAVFILIYAAAFIIFGLIETGDHHGEIHDPMIAVYFSVITWTTTGYGDFIPTESARVFAASKAFIGYVWMGILIAVLVRFFSRLAIH